MNLLTAWRDFRVDSPPFLLDEDKPLLLPSADKLIARFDSWQKFTEDSNFGRSSDTKLHDRLLPIPFIGDVKNAKVVLLLLNPGLEPADYFGEFEVRGFRERLERNLRQEFREAEYPFFYLDPDISWHSGYRYWNGKFRGLINELASRDSTCAETRLRFSQVVACIEMVPYQSAKYGLPEPVRRKLRSVELAHDYVNDVLRPRSEAGEVLIVVMRHSKEWGLSKVKNVVVYEGAARRAAHLTPNSEGGKRILKFLREHGWPNQTSAL